MNYVLMAAKVDLPPSTLLIRDLPQSVFFFFPLKILTFLKDASQLFFRPSLNVDVFNPFLCLD